jgi:hypothetical protein
MLKSIFTTALLILSCGLSNATTPKEVKHIGAIPLNVIEMGEDHVLGTTTDGGAVIIYNNYTDGKERFEKYAYVGPQYDVRFQSGNQKDKAELLDYIKSVAYYAVGYAFDIPENQMSTGAVYIGNHPYGNASDDALMIVEVQFKKNGVNHSVRAGMISMGELSNSLGDKLFFVYPAPLF